MATSKPVVTVFGATGSQGGSVVEALLSSDKYAIRAVTRNPSSDAAKSLAGKGVEVVGADMCKNDEIQMAVRGAYAVFSVTDFRSLGEKEFDCGSSVARLSKQEGVQHFVWSTLPNAFQISRGRYKVVHFTNKSRVDEVIMNLGFPHFTFYEPAFFFQNFSRMAHTRDDGVVTFDLPMQPHDFLTGFDVNDTGAAVVNAINKPDIWGKGKRMTMAAYHAPMSEWIEVFQKATGKKAILNTTEKSANDELTEMFAYFRYFTYFGNRDLTTGWKANPKMKTWEQWLPLSPWKN